MMDLFQRTEMLVGKEALEKLAAARVAVFGIGGVGGHAAEALARAGVGALDLFDGDVVALSNLNRQIVALHSTIGRNKANTMRERVLDINPSAQVVAHPVYYTPENADQYPLAGYHYIIDAVDMVAAKLQLAVSAQAANVPIVSAMGAGNKLDPTRFEVADIYATSVCPLARVMRKELKARGVQALKVVYSKEPPLKPIAPPNEDESARRATPGSISFVPSVAGLILAGEVIKDLIARP